MTPERFRRLKAVLDRRQTDLTVLLDNVHKPHNLSAILRSCDAVGVYQAHAVWPSASFRFHAMTSGGAGKWVKVKTHANRADATASLRASGFQVVAAHASAQAVDFVEVDFTQPTAIVLGAELTGVSKELLATVDRQVVIPMRGHVESLNVSVAAAILLFEARRQRQCSATYTNPSLPASEYAHTLFEWTHPRIADYCRRHGRAYPPLDDSGAIIGNEWRQN